jgi:serine/threonine-protein kinase HipA
VFSGEGTLAVSGMRLVMTADVYKGGRIAAELHRTADGIEFRYREEWIEAGGPAIATTLPVSGPPMLRPGGALPAYFAGLLPEGRRLGALRREVKTSADDELSLLLAVGEDTIGDVVVVPTGAKPGSVPPRVLVEDLGRTRFADLLTELGITAQRIGLPGVQDKTSAAMINLPVARAGERYILKLDASEFPYLVENETFFLGAARESGLTVPDFEIVRDADGAPGLLVRRFDRVTRGSTAASLAVEDGCQACGRPPADKYLLDVAEVFAALAAPCDARVLAGRELIRQLAFAYLIGNGDAHAKNFSILATAEGEWRISPLYDTPSSHPYGDTTMALPVGGREIDDLGVADFVALGQVLDVPDKAVRNVLRDLADRVDLWRPRLAELPFDRAKTAKLRRVVDYRRKRLAPPPPTTGRGRAGGPPSPAR